MSIRAKFVFHSITHHANGPGKTLVFAPSYDESIPEDRRFSKYTPNGEFKMYVDNPAAIEKLVLGKAYYFDITEADAAPAA